MQHQAANNLPTGQAGTQFICRRHDKGGSTLRKTNKGKKDNLDIIYVFLTKGNMKANWIYAAVILLFSCNKNEEVKTEEVFIPQPLSESANSIIFSGYEGSESFLAAFNLNGSVKWIKRGEFHGSGKEYMAYSNGKLYSIIGHLNASADFHAIDASNGNILWSKYDTKDIMMYPVVKNDTLFCCTKSTNSSFGSISAYSCQSGTMLWRKQIDSPYYPVNLTYEGNTLYFIIMTSAMEHKIVSFDINSRTVNWLSPSLGIVTATNSNIKISKSRVAVTAGGKNLRVFDKSTGALVWSKPGIFFEQSVIQAEKLYSTCIFNISNPESKDSLSGLYAFDVNTGTPIFRWSKIIAHSTINPFVSGNMLFYSAMSIDSIRAQSTLTFVKGFDKDSGREIWSRQIEETFQEIVAVGNRLYALKTFGILSGPSGAKVVTYDYSTGNPIDSMFVLGNSFGRMLVTVSNGKAYTTN